MNIVPLQSARFLADFTDIDPDELRDICQPVTAKDERAEQPAKITVSKTPEGNVVLEQFGSSFCRIAITQEQLGAILRYCSLFPSERSSNKVTLPGPLGEVVVRFFPKDRSFSISQAGNQLFGEGDIRQLLVPKRESDDESSRVRIELTDREQVVSGKRKLTRIQGDSKHVTLWFDSDNCVQGQLIDESFGGIGLEFNTEVPFQSGQELEVHYNGVQVCAIVRHTSVDDGRSRVGLEWKAVGLAQAARRGVAPGDDKEREEAIYAFKEHLPSGFYMMWKLLENESWFQLAETADKLRRLAAQCGVKTLGSFVQELQAAVQLTDPKERSVVALHALIEECLRLTVDAEVSDEFSASPAAQDAAET